MWSYQLTAPRYFEKIEIPQPDTNEIPAGFVLLQPTAGGICGSDLSGFAGYQSPYPTDLGPYAPHISGFPLHEVAGTVAFSNDGRLSVGEPVVGWAIGSDGLSELVVTDGESLAPYDQALEPSTAVMLQPLACVLYAVDSLGPIEGKRVAVIGQGPIGVLFSHVLKHRGAAHVTGVDIVDRADVAAVFGVDETVFGSSDRWTRQLLDSGRPDIVVEAVGHQTGTLVDAINAVAFGGLIYYFGIPETYAYSLDLWQMLRKQATLKTGTTLSRKQYLGKAGEYLKANPELAKAYVTNRYDLSNLAHAFEAASTPARGRLKVTIDYS
ncbi:MAG: hypothetical protein JWN95_1129 [Frankiales bacterium]|nr:hypothetical protein [Frankiales bacterium]